MAKKDFTAEFNEICDVMPKNEYFQRYGSKPAGSVQREKKQEGTTALTKNAAAEEQRCTFILNADTLRRLRAAAYGETGKRGKRVPIKDVLTEALQDYFAKLGY